MLIASTILLLASVFNLLLMGAWEVSVASACIGVVLFYVWLERLVARQEREKK